MLMKEDQKVRIMVMLAIKPVIKFIALSYLGILIVRISIVSRLSPNSRSSGKYYKIYSRVDTIH